MIRRTLRGLLTVLLGLLGASVTGHGASIQMRLVHSGTGSVQVELRGSSGRAEVILVSGRKLCRDHAGHRVRVRVIPARVRRLGRLRGTRRFELPESVDVARYLQVVCDGEYVDVLERPAES